MAKPVAQRGGGRQRVLEAALSLFAERGVAGTSLQDIANSLGVTKAAVYFQFHTKREIVLAVLEPVLEHLEDVVRGASACEGIAQKREAMLEGLIDVTIAGDKLAGVLDRDRVVAEILAEDPRLQKLTEQVARLLTGPRPSARSRVAVSVVGRGIAQARSDPSLADLDDAALRRELLRCARATLSVASAG